MGAALHNLERHTFHGIKERIVLYTLPMEEINILLKQKRFDYRHTPTSGPFYLEAVKTGAESSVKHLVPIHADYLVRVALAKMPPAFSDASSLLISMSSTRDALFYLRTR